LVISGFVLAAGMAGADSETGEGGGYVFNATFNNISVISWQSVLLVKETKVPGEKPPTCHKSLTNFIT
jgi:hypothetical protein